MLILKVRRSVSAFVALIRVASVAVVVVCLASPNLVYGGLLYEGFGSNGSMVTADLVSYGTTGTTADYTWAANGAAIVTEENGVVPFHDYETNPQMIRLSTTGSNAGKLKQRVSELGSSTGTNPVPIADIDAGNARGSFIVCFNQHGAGALAPAGAMATISLQFLDDSSIPLPVGAPVSLTQIVGSSHSTSVSDVAEWTHIELLDVVVPVGARGYEAIIEYDIASLGTSPIHVYVDKTATDFSVIPEPASLMLALCGMSLILGGRRFRS